MTAVVIAAMKPKIDCKKKLERLLPGENLDDIMNVGS